MQRRLRLALADECHEAWNAMPASGPGRSCARCGRDVVDLEGRTERQASAILEAETRRTESVCIRFAADEAGEARFAPEPGAGSSPAWLRGVMLAASLAAGCESVSHAATPESPPAVLVSVPTPPTPPGPPTALVPIPSAEQPRPALGSTPDAGTDAGRRIFMGLRRR